MKERRRIRRSSPDAPQGFVPVLTVFAGLVVVVVVTGIGFVNSDRAASDNASTDRVTVPGGGESSGATTVVPTTALIRGATTTTFFVTTTTPITTTTSTTTTTLPGPAVDTAENEVVFGPGETSVSFTVRSTDPEGIDIFVTGVPVGMEASPVHAVVALDSPATITLTLTDPPNARSGTLVLVGSDGSRVPVRVVVASDAFAIAAVGFTPDPPTCAPAARLVALVTGSGVTSVSAVITSAGGTVRVSMTPVGSGSWSATLPTGPAGSTVSGTVIATNADGVTAAKTFSTVLASGAGC